MSASARSQDPSSASRAPARWRDLVHGGQAREFSDAELFSALSGVSLVQATHTLEGMGGLGGLARAEPAELARCPGIGPAGASAIVAGLELGRRSTAPVPPLGHRLLQPREVARYLRSRLAHLEQEHFVVLGLDARQRVRLFRHVAVGSLSEVSVHPRELFRPLIRAGAHACILGHNHPSGDSDPSEADFELTRRMAEVGRLMGIPVLDHVVVSAEGYRSLAALGWLPS